jgi:hypothetical protein
MKITFTLTLLCLFLSVKSQHFTWAESYDISNANNLVAVAADAESNIYISGNYEAPSTLPYVGNAYLIKTNAMGEVLRLEYFEGSLLMGNIATVGTDLLIIGQAYDAFTYRSLSYGEGFYYMFAMMLDASGDVKWFFKDETKNGMNARISVGNTGTVAFRIRNQSNLGDWLMVIDTDGNILKSRQVSAQFSLVADIAFYNDRIYINGGFNGPGTVMVDTILISRPPTQNAGITMGFNEDLVAEWLFTDETFSNSNGRIAAGESGLFVFEPVVVNGFTARNSLKKFSFDGELLLDIDPPLFSSFSSFVVGMTVTPAHLGITTRNNFDHHSHIVLLFDHDLNTVFESEINGPSISPSGKICSVGEDIFVAHIHTGALAFGNQIVLPHAGNGRKPYIAAIGYEAQTRIENPGNFNKAVMVYPNPAKSTISIEISEIKPAPTSYRITDLTGRLQKQGHLGQTDNQINISALSAGTYLLQLFSEDNTGLTHVVGIEKLVIR